MSNSFLAQIIMMVLAIGMLALYVRPTMTEIGTIQDSIVQYKTERERVNDVNAKLAELVASVNNISSQDMTALLTYLPDKIDDVSIARDISAMANESGFNLNSVKYNSFVTAPLIDGEMAQPTRHEFGLSFSTSYDQIKSFLEKTEKNNYPLEVMEFKATASEDGLINVEMILATYSHI